MKTYLKTAIGILEIEEQDGYICSLVIMDQMPKNAVSEQSPILDAAISQLEEYFAGKRQAFDLPLKQAGTAFQQKAWGYMLTIPYGKTVSYKQEAEAIGKAKACRAVGSANGKNQIPIIIPCHRVINENGGLGGYAYGLEIKKFLLNLERSNSRFRFF